MGGQPNLISCSFSFFLFVGLPTNSVFKQEKNCGQCNSRWPYIFVTSQTLRFSPTRFCQYWWFLKAIFTSVKGNLNTNFTFCNASFRTVFFVRWPNFRTQKFAITNVSQDLEKKNISQNVYGFSVFKTFRAIRSIDFRTQLIGTHVLVLFLHISKICTPSFFGVFIF